MIITAGSLHRLEQIGVDAALGNHWGLHPVREYLLPHVPTPNGDDHVAILLEPVDAVEGIGIIGVPAEKGLPS